MVAKDITTMKNFAINQKLLHIKAQTILTMLAEEQAKAKVASENLTTGIDSAYWQEVGDIASGNCMTLQVKYYQVMKQLIEPIVFAKDQQNNVVTMSETFYAKN